MIHNMPSAHHLPRPTLSIVLSLLFLAGCAPETRVVRVNGDTFKITKDGGWGYDLNALESGVQQQARDFASSAGKDLEIIDQTVTPDNHVDVYPADDDTYTLTFRLIDRAKKP